MKLIAAILFLGPIYPRKLIFITLECIPRKLISQQIEPRYIQTLTIISILWEHGVHAMDPYPDPDSTKKQNLSPLNDFMKPWLQK